MQLKIVSNVMARVSVVKAIPFKCTCFRGILYQNMIISHRYIRLRTLCFRYVVKAISN